MAGYVKGHAAFIKHFEEDLYKSITDNFGKFSEETINSNSEKLLHLNAIKTKSANFVGRKNLRKRLVKYCTVGFT